MATTTTQDNNKIIWVAGNKQSVIIPMEQEVIPGEGEPYTEDFYPAEDDVVKVTLTGSYRPYIYTPEVDGHLLVLTDPGTLPKGIYGVQITVVGSNGDTRLRSFWDQQIVVTEKNNSVLKEWDEFKNQDVQARAAVFFFAKGDKGDTPKLVRLPDGIYSTTDNGQTYELVALFSDLFYQSTMTQTEPNVTVSPNILNVWGQMEALTVTFASGPEDAINEYMLQFTVNSDAFTLSLPEGIRWIEEPDWENGATYQVSVVNGLAVYGEWRA